MVLRLAGAARSMCMELDPAIVQNGQVIDVGDGNGPQMRTGLFVVLRGLTRKYAPSEQEVSVRSIAEATAFQMQHGESIDAALSRFEVLQHVARRDAAFDPGITGWSWMLLKGLGIHPQRWIDLLRPFGGQLPADDAAMTQLLNDVRAQYHLLQSDGLANAQNAAERQSRPRLQDFGRGSGHHYYPSWGEESSQHPMQMYPSMGAPGYSPSGAPCEGGPQAGSTADDAWSSSATDEDENDPWQAFFGKGGKKGGGKKGGERTNPRVDGQIMKCLALSLIHISEPTRPERISYAVFCLKKKK